MAEMFVGKASDFADRGRKVVAHGNTEIGIFRIGDAFYAYDNNCVHQGGPVCQGRIIPRVEEVLDDDRTSQGLRFSEDCINIVCPWHGYEYDLRTGRHQGDARLRLRPYEVKLDGDDVYVVVDATA
ncbi:MAG: Rieske 2Fe-2S domain-containing protein [Alphaproteobacteria bacterium]|nr:Rieske 2Fe-2S domain-containing protein [Alphaproteobacteria bacterium]